MGLRTVSAIAFAAAFVLAASAYAQTTWHVDDDNCPGPGPGTEAGPFCKIQDSPQRD